MKWEGGAMSEYQHDFSRVPEEARVWARDPGGHAWWWKESLLRRPIDNNTEIRAIREELAALTERLAKLEEGA